MILGNRDIKKYLEEGKLVISPLTEDTIRENGVDLRVGDEILRFKPTTNPIDINDTDMIKRSYLHEKVVDSFVLNPNERVLIKIKESIKMPNNVIGFSNVRSTFARLGIFMPPTIVDAGFEGDLTILIIGGDIPIKIAPDTRLLYLVFSTTKSEVTKPYRGKYYKSKGITHAKI
jgi:dCTP deaminase